MKAPHDGPATPAADSINSSAPVEPAYGALSIPKVAMLLGVVAIVVVVLKRRGRNTLRSKSTDDKTMV